MNNYEGWHHIGTAPKNKQVFLWDGKERFLGEWSVESEMWHSRGWRINPTHWRGCPPPPPIALPDDEE